LLLEKQHSADDVLTGDVWVSEFDPLHVMLRAVYRHEIQQSMDRYVE